MTPDTFSEHLASRTATDKISESRAKGRLNLPTVDTQRQISVSALMLPCFKRTILHVITYTRDTMKCMIFCTMIFCTMIFCTMIFCTMIFCTMILLITSLYRGLKIFRLEVMLLDEIVKVGPVFSCQFRCLAHVTLGERKEANQVAPFKFFDRFFKRF